MLSPTYVVLRLSPSLPILAALGIVCDAVQWRLLELAATWCTAGKLRATSRFCRGLEFFLLLRCLVALMPPQRQRKKSPVCKEPLPLIGRRRKARNPIEDTGSHDVSANIARIHELAEAYVRRGRLIEKDYEIHRQM